MKKLALFVLLGWALLPTTAAEVPWFTDFAKARVKAETENKPILIYFTASNWSSNCMALKREVLTTPEFVEYAEANLVLLEVDFPRNSRLSMAQKKANNELKEKYKQQGFPTLVLVSPKSEELGRHIGYTAGRDSGRILTKIKGWKAGKP